NAGKLEFPFRRYQIQPVWRGERPQEGRYRQFTQADIDVVGRDELPFHHDVEVVRVMVEALDLLPLPNLAFPVNNRKLIPRLARGLDYSAGTVVEVFMAGYERLKSVGGGGRYDALASDGRTTYPGVGISFGVSRTLIPLFSDGVLAPGPKVPSQVLVAVVDEE